MATFKIRYFVTRPGPSAPRHFWSPSRALVALGWRLKRLDDDRARAIEEAEGLNAELDRWRRGEAPPHAPASVSGARAGSVDALIVLYRASPEWSRLADSTRRGYLQCLAIIGDWCGPAPARAVTRKAVRDFYRKMRERTPAFANAVLRVLRILFQFAVNEGWVPVNPAHKPGLIGTPSRSAMWTPAAIAAFVAAADRAGRGSLGTAVLLAAYLGQREGDVLRLAWRDYKTGAFTLRQGKTGRLIAVPAHPALEARLSLVAQASSLPVIEIESRRTIVVNETTGQAYSPHTFRHDFAALRADVPEAAGLWYMDLRRTAVVRLAEAGCTEAEIAAVSGHQIETCRRILETYLPRTGAMAGHAIAKLVNFKGEE